ncbi:isochorismatase family protein [Helicobacter sp. L8]|uniref:isochorismatase family protein n=1 Tax=Helicobacter sp. L8 TaxID=2316078 RepID=UPI000EAFFADF|nr:isochorismatase family protein [Helicobacter sp. L8]
MFHVLVIDIQEKLLPVMAQAETLLANCVKFLQIAQELELKILASEQNPSKLGPSVAPLQAFLGTPHTKEHFSAAPILAPLLPPKTRLVVLGIEAHVCVYQSVKDLLRAGFEVVVLQDCTSSRDMNNKALALADLQSCGARILSSEIVAFECLQTYTHPSFRAISKLIK